MIARDWPLGARQGMKGRPMRWVICALVVLGFAPRAFAGDFDILRGWQPVGPATFTRWSGFYFGGQLGYGDASADFSNATQTPIAYALREMELENEFSPSHWPVLGSSTNGRSSYGGFVGFNTQWQDLILGIEANYTQASFSLFAPVSPISRVTPADTSRDNYLVNITASGRMTNLDFASLRGRAGWIWGNFLPYGFVGFALGRADIAVSATVSGEQDPPASGGTCSSSNTPPCVPFSFTGTRGRNSELMYGFTVGGGLDVAVTQHVFLRGEYEFVQFAPVEGIVANIASARVGGGIKF
jgi:outer membrane immunogenic protein